MEHLWGKRCQSYETQCYKQLFWFPGTSLEKSKNWEEYFFLKNSCDIISDSFCLPLINSWGFPCGSAGKESARNAGDMGSIPGLGRSPGDGKGYPLQYSGLENSTDCIVHGDAKSRTWLSDFHFTISSYLEMWSKCIWLSTKIFIIM